MKTQPRKLDPKTAVLIGTVMINVPVFCLLFGPAVAAGRLGLGNLIWPVLVVSFLAAWAWWSWSVPRWRLWAYERVPSTGELQQKAQAAGLLWPRGSFFERTEIKTLAQRQQQADLERRFP
jgi:hypothetical protein